MMWGTTASFRCLSSVTPSSTPTDKVRNEGGMRIGEKGNKETIPPQKLLFTFSGI